MFKKRTMGINLLGGKKEKTASQERKWYPNATKERAGWR